MIWLLQAIIGYGTSAIYCPSPGCCLTSRPAHCCCIIAKACLAPVCTRILFLTSSLVSCVLFPRDDYTSLFPLSLEQSIWKTSHVSTPFHHIQSPACLFSSPPSLQSQHHPLLCSLCPTRWHPYAHCVSVLHHITAYHRPVFFNSFLSPSICFSPHC